MQSHHVKRKKSGEGERSAWLICSSITKKELSIEEGLERVTSTGGRRGDKFLCTPTMRSREVRKNW